jgi:hypothetical protein
MLSDTETAEMIASVGLMTLCVNSIPCGLVTFTGCKLVGERAPPMRSPPAAGPVGNGGM